MIILGIDPGMAIVGYGLIEIEKENKYLPNPMSSDKQVIRTTLIPSLLNTYYYNKAN